MKAKKGRSQVLQIKARQLLEQGRLDDALSTASEAHKKDPNNADVQFLLAAIHAQRQDYPRVADHCQNVIQLQPSNALAHFNLGLARQSMGDQHSAAEAYRRALDLQPNYPAAHINLTAALLETGHAAEALTCSEAALAAAPNMPAAHLAKGRALLLSGQTQAAFEYLLEIQQRFGQLPDIAINIALCHKALGKSGQARELLNQLKQTSPGYEPVWVELGHLEQKAENYLEAAQHYQRAASIHPKPETLFKLAHCLYAADRIEPAHKLYHQLLEKDPDNPLIHNNLGRLYERLGQLESAERHLRRAVDLQPGHAIPHCNLGRVLYGQGQYEAAREEYDYAITADPDYFEGHFGRGQSLCELGEHAAAIESFKTAHGLKPDLTEAKYYIASLGDQAASEADRHNYVAGLFDHYAEKFDHELVNRLKYSTPEHIFNAAQSVLPTNTSSYDILDLGCGTGLCAPLFRPMARRLVGVDLSGKMIDKARERKLYDDLAVDDITTFMKQAPRSYDLVIAADVFVYIGDLAATFDAARTTLNPAGHFIFSTETCPDDDYKIRGSGRHAHSKHYIYKLATSSGFEIINDTDCDLRLEYGKPVSGTIYLLRSAQ
ncbi:MAG: tetratricopeptide repeat protein [Gammaproteobacteria bacterium]|nr:tetratricopeptide repeat protein [Gammaproteobacteria bacterium]MBU2477932.1 tetratricopeptide repeat protein [Gammaproteobacteria bacterium]